MTSKKIRPMSQKGRRPCSIPLGDADLSLGNANWSKGLQAMSDWIWSGNLNPKAFPNNLARYFLQIPAIFEHQLQFSTSLIFDEPSFRNGVQVSGFLDRVVREMVIQFIAQRRRAWYTMTHHAVLGRLTCIRHGLQESEFALKWSRLLDYRASSGTYTDVEREVLRFADAFSSDPKKYSNDDYSDLRRALSEANKVAHPGRGLWLRRLQGAQLGHAEGLLQGLSGQKLVAHAKAAAKTIAADLPSSLNERLIDAQVVELTFLCTQFVALADVFSGLSIPDEDFLADVMVELVPDPVISRINELNELGGKDFPSVISPIVDPPLDAILAGRVIVDPAPMKGARIPLTPYEGKDENGNFRPAFLGAPDRDKGISVGGAQGGTYGWSFGGHFPGGLVYALMNHPELSRFEAPYSLPLIFNEEEWRNGTQTGGFVSRRIKEYVIQKVYRIVRGRYGLEHHTIYFYNTFLDEHGVGRLPNTKFSQDDIQKARNMAIARAEQGHTYVHIHDDAPSGTYSELEQAVLTWVEALVHNAHNAHEHETRLRTCLVDDNTREIESSLRILDDSPGLGSDAAMTRLVDHQISEIAMLGGHFDGLGRAMTMLQLEGEQPVQMIEGRMTQDGGILPDTDAEGRVQFTGYFNNRPGIHQVYPWVGIDKKVLTINELFLNPKLCEIVKQRLAAGEDDIEITAEMSAQTGEF